MSDARDNMIQVLTDELTNFLLSEPDNACRMSDIHRFAEISTFKPRDFGCRWIDLLPTIEAVAIKGEGLNKVICLRPNSSDQPGSLQDPINTEADQMKQVMIEELREFLFFKPDQEWKMNEIQRFAWTSTYQPKKFGVRWNELLPALDVATTSGSGNQKVFRLTPEHYTIALCNFKRDIKKALLRENGPMTVSHLNYLLYGVDSSVTDCQISDRLKDCHPEITSRWEKSQQFVILSKMNSQE